MSPEVPVNDAGTGVDLTAGNHHHATEASIESMYYIGADPPCVHVSEILIN
jgi:hypothetical protein